MPEESIARRGLALAIVLALGLCLAVIATDSRTDTTYAIFSSQEPSLAIDEPQAAVSGTSPSVQGSITLSAPVEGTQILPGQTYSITLSVAPVQSPLDRVTIQVSEMGAQTVLQTATVPVQSGGTFTFLATVGLSWPTGTYVIRATDSYGLAGNVTFLVTFGDQWIG